MDTREMTFLDRFILGKPVYRGVFEWLILVIVGVMVRCSHRVKSLFVPTLLSLEVLS